MANKPLKSIKFPYELGTQQDALELLESMLTTLLEQEYNFKELNCDALLYDEINDEKVNKYLRDDIINGIMEFCKRRDRTRY